MMYLHVIINPSGIGTQSPLDFGQTGRLQTVRKIEMSVSKNSITSFDIFAMSTMTKIFWGKNYKQPTHLILDNSIICASILAGFI